MFKITAQAAETIRAQLPEGLALRFAAQRQEDGTFHYLMGFDEPNDDDIRFTSQGVAIVMAPEYVPLLDETTLDYARLDDGQTQFIFLNPKDANYNPPTGSR